MCLRNIGSPLLDYMTTQPTKQYSSKPRPENLTIITDRKSECTKRLSYLKENLRDSRWVLQAVLVNALSCNLLHPFVTT
jgi:hypothetical protein